MSSLLQRASVLAATLACIAVNAYAEGPDRSEVRAFLDSVREFGQPGLQSDAGLLIYPTDPRLPQPQVAYVPYTEPSYVTNHVHVAPRRAVAVAPVLAYYPTQVGRNGPPSIAQQMQLQSQVVRRGNGTPSQAVLMQQQQRTGLGTATHLGQHGSYGQRP